MNTLPVVVQRDKAGLPRRVTVPGGMSHAVPLLVAHTKVGRVARDGTVTLRGPSSASTAEEFSQLGEAESALTRGRLRAVLAGGEVVAVLGDSDLQPSVAAARMRQALSR